MSDKEWIPKAQKDREIVDKTLRYWREDVKNNPHATQEEKIIFVIMDVIGRCRQMGVEGNE